MSEYTPTTEDVRGAYRAWHDGQGDDHALKPTWSAQEFDRWLAAHDAEVRAGVVAEEPEWEYGVRATGDSEPFTDHYESLNEMSEEFDGRVVWNTDEEIVRRRKAGPWVPVKQEGAGDAS